MPGAKTWIGCQAINSQETLWNTYTVLYYKGTLHENIGHLIAWDQIAGRVLRQGYVGVEISTGRPWVSRTLTLVPSSRL